MTSPEDVLQYWFGPPDSAPDARSDLWWGMVDDQEAVDREIEETFGDLVDAALAGELDAWREAPESCLAYVITLDQFTRHIYRGSRRAFVGDERARRATQLAWERGYHEELSVPERVFLTMPMMHAEDREIQREGVEMFEWIVREAPEEGRDIAEGTLKHAREHSDIIQRFGRFPHRNPVLDREMTDEEARYLEKTGNWYGQKPD